MSQTCPNQEKSDDPIQHATPKEEGDSDKPSHDTANESASVRAVEKDPEEAINEDAQEKLQTGGNSQIIVKRRSGSRYKHRVRRNRKRRWKPYSKLSWNERMALDERDARRVHKIREQMSASGIVLAPYNTTQFLMNDHNIQESDYDYSQNGQTHMDSNHEGEYSENDSPSLSVYQEYMFEQFREDYDNFHNQYLDSLSQEELVCQWVELEDQIEKLEKKLSGLRQKKRQLGCDALDRDAEMTKIEVFRDEIRKITIENEKLEKCNRELHSFLGYS